MADVGKVVVELQQAGEGMGKASSLTAQVDARATQVQSRAAANGFRGVAEGMGKVRERLKRINEMQAGVVTSVKQTGEVVQGVTEDMSPADVVSTLSPAAQQLGSSSTATSAIVAEVDGAKTDIAAALRGGTPGPLIALADQLKQALTQVRSHLGGAKQRTEETIAAARQTGNF